MMPSRDWLTVWHKPAQTNITGSSSCDITLKVCPDWFVSRSKDTFIDNFCLFIIDHVSVMSSVSQRPAAVCPAT